MKAVIQYLKSVRLELSKVVWPKKEEIIKLTLIVFIISAVVAAYTGALDFVFTKLLEKLIAR